MSSVGTLVAPPSFVHRLLASVEKLGNRLPHPTLLFIYLCGLVLLASGLAAGLQFSALHPQTSETINTVNLLSGAGLVQVLTKAVTNFTHFAPVGTVLVAILGIGIAEHSGLLSAALRATVLKAPAKLLSFVVVICGVLSSLAADTGYVVLIPLAAIVFAGAGRSPIVGIAAAFAGVSGGFSANLLIGPFDAIMAGITTEAAMLVRPDYEVNAAGNYYFIVVSTLLIGALGTWVTERWVAPRFTAQATDPSVDSRLTAIERRGLKAVGFFSLMFMGLLGLLLWPEDGVLRGANGSILKSPFMSSIVVLVTLYAALAGVVFGKVSGRFKQQADIVQGMEASMATMAGYLVLMFFAAQFVSYFSWSNLGIIAAIKGAEFLQLLVRRAGQHPHRLVEQLSWLGQGRALRQPVAGDPLAQGATLVPGAPSLGQPEANLVQRHPA